MAARHLYAALALRGLNLKEWAEQNGFKQSTVWRTVHRDHQGRISLAIRERIRADLGD
jgi:DNA-binding LacI/PurR family transcriptional regulator